MQTVEIFTDGACRGNPGPGGWGAIFCYSNRESNLWGGETLTTNNRMELTAPIIALESLEASAVAITTDSQYVKKGITEWLSNWKRRGWKTASGSAVKNQDLWERLEKAVAKHQVTWHWTRGHSGNVYNERADKLANRAIDELLMKAG